MVENWYLEYKKHECQRTGTRNGILQSRTGHYETDGNKKEGKGNSWARNGHTLIYSEINVLGNAATGVGCVIQKSEAVHTEKLTLHIERILETATHSWKEPQKYIVMG